MRELLHGGLELLAGVEGDDATRRDRDFLAGLGVAPRTLGLVAELEVAEAGELDGFATLQGRANLLEETLDHVLGLALVQPHPFKKQFGQFGLGQCRAHFPYPRSVAPKEASASPTMAEMADSTSESSSVR